MTSSLCSSCDDADRAVGGLSRRRVLQSASASFGWMAFSALHAEQAEAKPNSVMTHHRAKARSVIFCFMDGGPSHVDTFDPKPMLTRHQGQKIGDRLNNTLYNDPNRVWVYEVYVDEAGFQAHTTAPPYIRWRAPAKDWRDEAPVGAGLGGFTIWPPDEEWR